MQPEWERSGGARAGAAWVGAIARTVLALPLACLPPRYWPQWDAWPVRGVAVLSGILTLGGGAIFGAIGFLRFARAAASVTTDRLIESAINTPAGQNPDFDSLTTSNLQSLSILSLPVFILATPLGWLSTYLVVSGLLRAVSASVDQPLGDPLATLVDAGVRRMWTSTRARTAQLIRERREGPAVADRLVTGERWGLPGETLVVLAARRKVDWTSGTIVLTDTTWYRLGDPFDVELPQGLRTAYPLTPMTTVEVVRRGVRYTLPPLQTTSRPAGSILGNPAGPGVP